MPRRYVPPVATEIAPAALAGAFRHVLSSGDPRAELRALLLQHFGRTDCVLVDSGTSALVLALQHAAAVVHSDGARQLLVAIPGFGCIDVAAAVQGSNATAVPYDVDPVSLGPDLHSLEDALRYGARVVVASHLFGLPLDLTATRALCQRFGALLVEDAAQAAGARMRGAAVGNQGDYVVLSFGRGKGIGGGGGGALLGGAVTSTPPFPSSPVTSLRHTRELRVLASVGVISLLARPRWYAIPAAMPWLRLGEMVYRRAGVPHDIDVAAASLAASALRQIATGIAVRHAHAMRLRRAAQRGTHCEVIEPHAESQPGWLRAPMLQLQPAKIPLHLGVARPYPRTVATQHEIRDCLVPVLPRLAGASLLADRLITLPTHHRLEETDMRALEGWLIQ